MVGRSVTHLVPIRRFLTIELVIAGVAIGAGLQAYVAIVNACCYYIIGLPLGIVLAYVADLQIEVHFL